MENYLMAVSAVDDAIVVPFSRVKTLACTADATIGIYCEPGIDDPTGVDANSDLITLTITADTEVAVLKTLTEKLLGAQNGPGGQAGVLMICVYVHSVFAPPDILSCVIATSTV